MARNLRIDVVSDLSCPWCFVGLGRLEAALRIAGTEVRADLHFQPFELNPAMAPEGENITEYVGRRYNVSRSQAAANRERIHAEAAGVGLDMRTDDTTRVYNTFDAHRLLHWADTSESPAPGLQLALKRELFAAYFTRGASLADHDVLADSAARVGLDRAASLEVLHTQRYSDAVRELEAFWLQRGIRSVPSMIVDNKRLIEGGQPPELLAQMLRTLGQAS